MHFFKEKKAFVILSAAFSLQSNWKQLGGGIVKRALSKSIAHNLRVGSFFSTMCVNSYWLY